MTVISGVYSAPDGTPLSGVKIDFKLVRTTAGSFKDLESSVTTDESGVYSIRLYPGMYRVEVTTKSPGYYCDSRYHQDKAQRLGTINILFDSCDGSLNDYLLVGQESCNKPDYLAAIQAMYFDMKKMAASPHDPVTHVETEKDIPAQIAGFVHVESDVRMDGQPCVYLYAGNQKIWIAGVVVEDE